MTKMPKYLLKNEKGKYVTFCCHLPILWEHITAGAGNEKIVTLSCCVKSTIQVWSWDVRTTGFVAFV